MSRLAQLAAKRLQQRMVALASDGEYDMDSLKPTLDRHADAVERDITEDKRLADKLDDDIEVDQKILDRLNDLRNNMGLKTLSRAELRDPVAVSAGVFYQEISSWRECAARVAEVSNMTPEQRSEMEERLKEMEDAIERDQDRGVTVTPKRWKEVEELRKKLGY